MKRRANNTGNVYKMSGRRSNPWAARICQGYNENGKRIWLNIGYYRTKSDAEKAISLHEIQPVSEKKDIKLNELFKEWSASHYVGLGKKSITMYNTAFNHLAILHNKKFADLRTIHFQKILNDSVLKNSAQSKIKTFLNLLYTFAISQDIVHKNYSTALKIIKKEKHSTPVFSQNDIEVLFKNDHIPFVDSILVMIYTSSRPNEMLMITKDRVDFENGFVITGIKTEEGIDRPIPIHPYIYDYLRKRYNQTDNYLFHINGKRISDRTYREDIFFPIVEKLNITGIYPRFARHTFGTLAAKYKLSNVAIQQIMGHTDYAFTANTYTQKDLIFLKNEMRKIQT